MTSGRMSQSITLAFWRSGCPSASFSRVLASFISRERGWRVGVSREAATAETCLLRRRIDDVRELDRALRLSI